MRKWPWIVLIVLIGACQHLNTTGYCYSEQGYISDEALIANAVKFHVAEINSRQKHLEKSSITSEYVLADVGCCHAFHGFRSPDLPAWLAAFGVYEQAVHVDYKLPDQIIGRGSHTLWTLMCFSIDAEPYAPAINDEFHTDRQTTSLTMVQAEERVGLQLVSIIALPLNSICPWQKKISPAKRGECLAR